MGDFIKQTLANVLASAIIWALSSGFVLAALIAGLGNVVGNPKWIDRGITALCTCAGIVGLALVLSFFQRRKTLRVEEVRVPAGQFGIINDWLKRMHFNWAELNTSHAHLITAWNGFIVDLRKAAKPNALKTVAWDAALHNVKSRHVPRISSAYDVFDRRLKVLSEVNEEVATWLSSDE